MINGILKICCIKSANELKKAISKGADHVGFVSDMPSGPGAINDNEIIGLINETSDSVTSVLLT